MCKARAHPIIGHPKLLETPWIEDATFSRAQVSNAVMQHRTLTENLRDHSTQAQDQRYPRPVYAASAAHGAASTHAGRVPRHSARRKRRRCQEVLGLFSARRATQCNPQRRLPAYRQGHRDHPAVAGHVRNLCCRRRARSGRGYQSGAASRTTTKCSATSITGSCSRCSRSTHAADRTKSGRSRRATGRRKLSS